MNEALIKITAGSGGAESQDWVRLLLRMYVRRCERSRIDHDYSVLDDGAMLWAFGPTVDSIFGNEDGVHRLVRISPFDPHQRRHTSFATVSVTFPTPRDDDGPVRSYVLDLYELATDHRTGREVKDVKSLLDGQK